MTIHTGNCNHSVENSLYGITGHLFQRLQQWFARQRVRASLQLERKQLLAMSDQMLRDIGITREQAMEEAKREDIPAERITGQY